jgi:hypothetical protein
VPVSRTVRFIVILVAVASAVVVFLPSVPSKAASLLALITSAASLWLTVRRRSVLNSATCPSDGGPLQLSLRRWGARGAPLMWCPLEQRHYYLSRWAPPVFTQIDLPGQSS